MRSQDRIGKRVAAVMIAAFVFACTLFASTLFASTPAQAQDGYYYKNPVDSDNPLRIVDYFLQPIGTLLEWTVTRPLAKIGDVVAPYQHIDYKGFRGCSRERPSRSCTDVIK